MNVLQRLICAVLVFVAYCTLGYYRPWGFFKALWDYFSEQRKLKAQVLSVHKYGLPVGTIMCSKDRGSLPVDIAFPAEMEKLRVEFGNRIGYFGKFAVIPFLQGKTVGTQLLKMVVTEWSFDNAVSVGVMMVNPKHVAMYRRRGARVVASIKGTKGLEKAPAVLMVIDYNHSAQVMSAREKYQQEQKA